MVNIFSKSLMVTAAGALTALAFSPVNLFLFSLIGPVVLYYATFRTKTKYVVILFGLLSLSLHLSGAHWIIVPLLEKSHAEIVAILLFALFIIILALHFALFGYIYSVLSARVGFHPVLFGLIWGSVELSREFVFSGFPFLTIGFSWVDSSFRSLLGFLGVQGVSIFLVVFSIFTIDCLKRRKIYLAGFSVVVFFVIYGVSVISTSRIDYGKDIKVAMIQPGLSASEKNNNHYREKTLDLISSSRKFIGYDLIVWPETALPRYGRISDLMDPFRKELDSNNTALLSGFVFRGKSGFAMESYNSIGLFSMGDSAYHKVKLIDFFERIPNYPYLKNFAKKHGFENDFKVSSNNISHFNVSGLNIAPFICYEIAFNLHAYSAYNTSDLIVNVVNDGWFKNTVEPYQHLQIARARAVESGRWVLRSANDGVSAFIEPNGDVFSFLDRDQSGFIDADITVYRNNNLYGSFGFLNVVFVLIIYVFLFWFFKLN